MNGSLLARTIAAIPLPDVAAADSARARQNRLTKPPGSLGILEELSVRIAGMTGEELPRLDRKSVIVAAADHGVTAEGVSAYPQEVTGQMVANFLSGGAAINVLSRFGSIEVTVVDAGIVADLPVLPGVGFVSHKIGRGTANIRRGPAMSEEQAAESVELGIETAGRCIDSGARIVGTGEMGIGNTTSATAVAAVLTGRSPAELAGRGTGIPAERVGHKVRVVEDAIAVNAPDPSRALDVLARVGGFEIGCLAGVIIGAAARRTPVVVDGFIACAAALVAAGLAERSIDYMIAGHRSAEAGQAIMLEKLGLRPLLSLEMRLGEGTGAALAMVLAEAACRVLSEMATFDEAGVSGAAEGMQ